MYTHTTPAITDHIAKTLGLARYVLVYREDQTVSPVLEVPVSALTVEHGDKGADTDLWGRYFVSILTYLGDSDKGRKLLASVTPSDRLHGVSCEVPPFFCLAMKTVSTDVLTGSEVTSQ